MNATNQTVKKASNKKAVVLPVVKATQEATKATRKAKKVEGTKLVEPKAAEPEKAIKTTATSTTALEAAVGVMLASRDITNMLFMKKGDAYIKYIKAVKLDSICTYPAIRAHIEADLDAMNTSYQTTKTSLMPDFPWGNQGIKMKAHSMAVTMLKTWERRNLKFGTDGKATATVTMKVRKGEVITDTKTINKNSVHKDFDKAFALRCLESFLK